MFDPTTWDAPFAVVVLALFVVLFAHVATGFTHALFGFYVLNRGGDTRRIQRTLPWWVTLAPR